MKMREKRGYKGSVLDIAVVLLALACLLAVGVRWYGMRHAGKVKPLDTVHVVLYADDVDRFTAECIAPNNVLYRADNSVFGMLRTVEILEQPLSLVANGECYTGAWDPTRMCRLRLVVAVEGGFSEQAFLLDGRVPLSLNESLRLHTAYVELSCFTVAMEQITP